MTQFDANDLYTRNLIVIFGTMLNDLRKEIEDQATEEENRDCEKDS